MTKTISKSTKDRKATRYVRKDGEIMRVRDKGSFSIAWKQIVEIEPIGKNKKGKTIHSSRTKHVPA